MRYINWDSLSESNNWLSTRMNKFISEDHIACNLSKFESGKSNTLFVTGMSGSGKSTLCKKLAKKYKCTIVSTDDLFNMYKMDENTLAKNIPLLYEYISQGHEDKNWAKSYNFDSKKQNSIAIKKIDKFLSWCIKHKSRKIIEGVDIPIFMMSHGLFEEPIIFVGTSKYKSLFRRFKRDGYDVKYLVQDIIELLPAYDNWEDHINSLRSHILTKDTEMRNI
jgi:dephospho-CoA kinase